MEIYCKISGLRPEHPFYLLTITLYSIGKIANNRAVARLSALGEAKGAIENIFFNFWENYNTIIENLQ